MTSAYFRVGSMLNAWLKCRSAAGDKRYLPGDVGHLELTRFDGHGFMDSGHHEGGFVVKGAEVTEPCLGPFSVVEDLDVVEEHAAEA